MQAIVVREVTDPGHDRRALENCLSREVVPLDNLKPYDRATVCLWRRGHTQLVRETSANCLVTAATHAVLAGLRRQTTPFELLACYGTDAAADLALIGSLLPEALAEACWRVRDAAFYLRWLELADDE